MPSEIDTFHLVRYVPRQDWGNPVLREFTKLMERWAPRLNLVAAKGFFKAAIARKRADAPVWSWALEWNQNWRVIGFAGRHDDVRDAVIGLPRPSGHDLGNGWLMWQETPLDEAEDTLFQNRLSREG